MSDKTKSVENDSAVESWPKHRTSDTDARKDDDCEEKQATRKLQFVVYPSLLAFVILAGYGFYMVRSLTADVNRLAQTIVDMNHTIRDNLSGISENMNAMSGHMVSMVASANQIGAHVAQLDESVIQMGSDVQQMNMSTQNMAVSTYNMQQDMWSMNKNVSKPFRMMGNFMPFMGSGSSGSRIVSAPPATYYYPAEQYAGYWSQLPAGQSPATATLNGQQPTVTSQPVPVANPQQQQPVGQLVIN